MVHGMATGNSAVQISDTLNENWRIEYFIQNEFEMKKDKK